MEVDDRAVPLPSRTVEGLLDLGRDLAALDDLPTILERIVRAILDVAGFECAAINLVIEGGDLKVVVVHGPPDAVETLLGTVASRSDWDVMLSEGERHGAVLLNFDGKPADVVAPEWIPDDEEWFARKADDPRAWMPEYAVYVPMTDLYGDLVGVVSVDMPRSGLIPDTAQLAAVEILARQAEAAIVSSQALARTALDEHIFASVFEVARAAMAICDRTGLVVRSNRQFRDAFRGVVDTDGFDELVTEVEAIDGTAPVGLGQAVREMLDGPVGERAVVVRVGDPDDGHWYHVVVRGVAYDEAAPIRVVCTFTDITAERRIRQRYQHDAAHDPLTGLLNRRGFHAAAAAAVAPSGAVVAVMFCDLDGLKSANDLHGHQYGDEVLVKASEQLRIAVPAEAVLARLGGDEFVIWLHCSSREEVEKVADDIVRSVVIAMPRRADADITVSVGMALSQSSDDRDTNALMHRADTALYRAKVDGKARWVIADDGDR